MKIISNKLTVCILFSFLMLNSNAIKAQEKLPYQNSELKIEERINDLLPRMTLEEKVELVTGDKIPEKGVIGSEGIKAF